ncbi:restriction endonuclease subunit S [Vibrio cholerae]|uniref:restriction endonuclease subunit S n=1 Tax=Vibrio cholerae TaxID=666 RepID=UPI000F0B4833|nr:restriction endonuclease subunit S [Vibrio cholerae]RNE82992.1 restriction endonuclease subunit S [Vibrio cholerae]
MCNDYLVKIGDIATVFDGPHATPTKIEHGPYFLSISSLEAGQLDLSKSARLSEEQFDKWTRRVTPQEGDVLFSYETRLGEAALMPKGVKACLGRRMGLLRPALDKVLPEYLLYAYMSPMFQQEIKKRTIHGATVDRISLKELPDFNIRIPPLSEQARVVNVLKSLNQKLSLNHQINQTLEQMAQTLFKSWFVDFDPVMDNALDAGNPIPDELQHRAEARKAVRESEGFKPLPDEVRQLFPDAFEESELGWVPKGWAISTISDMARINSKTWSKKSAPEVVEYVDLSNAKNGVILGTDVYVFDEAPSRARRILNKKDTIFGLVRPANRSYAFVDKDGLTGSTGFAVVTAKKSNGANFIYQLLTSDNIIDLFIRIADGAAYPAIKPDDIADVQFAMPSDQVLDYFELVANSYKERSAIGLTNNINLTALRDTLLPKLISGELRLDEIELAVEQEAVSAEQQNER